MNNEMLNYSNNITNTVNKSISKIDSDKAAAISKIDAEIERLEAEERRAAELAKKKKSSSDSNTNTDEVA